MCVSCILQLVVVVVVGGGMEVKEEDKQQDRVEGKDARKKRGGR